MESKNKLEQILSKYGISSFATLEANLFEQDMHDELFEFWLPEMPYGVAKARDGDPDYWMFDQTVKLMGWE